MEPKEALQLTSALLEEMPMNGQMRDRSREALGVLGRVIDILESQPKCACVEGDKEPQDAES